MKSIFPILFLLSFPIFSQNLRQDFQAIPTHYRPMPFLHMNGKLTFEELEKQLIDTKKAGFGGVTILPVSEMTPPYLSEEYFQFYKFILDKAKALDMKVIWYDDVDFPSGSAGKRLKQKYPNDIRKILYKTDILVSGNISLKVPEGNLMAVVAMDIVTKQRIDLQRFIKENVLNWIAPSGKWKVMFFTSKSSGKESINHLVVDYLDPDAIDKFFTLNHDEFTKRFPDYFGTTISQLFFDDVGYYTGDNLGERTWTDKFNQKFKALIGKNPAIYYPALWEDIGEETQAARVAFFDTRAELLAEGFPRKTKEWASKYNILSSGHPPGNYELQPTDFQSDVIKYYRHSDIPTMDLIFYHGHGREGYKLVSSSANLFDRPIVSSEIYGAISGVTKVTFDNNLLYQCAMEVFARGINQIIPHGMWYDYAEGKIRIPPLISPYNPAIAEELPKYNEWAARCSIMLQGGQTVSDLGVIYPIYSLQSWFYFEAKENKKWGTFVAPETDYLKLSDILTNQIHQDFTFVHPEYLALDKYQINGNQLVLDKNRQKYNTLILTGGETFSWKTLQKINQFYQAGGKIIATSKLPIKSAEFGKDKKITQLVNQLFSKNTGEVKANKNGGKTLFLVNPTLENLKNALSVMNQTPDVIFENNPMPNSRNGCLNYIHKQKNKQDIYYFSNSSKETIDTYIQLKGQIKPEFWNPHTGAIQNIENVSYITQNGQIYTRIPLKLEPIKTIFVVAQ